MEQDLNASNGACCAEVLQRIARKDIDASLENIGQSKKCWLWFVFIMTACPGFFNGMHIMSYVFLVDNDPHYCEIPSLEKSNWTLEQIRDISSPKSESSHLNGCEYYDFDFAFLSKLSFDEALSYVRSLDKLPKVLPCRNYKYETKDSVVSKWDLVCDRYYYRTHIQSAYAIGKFFGASFFGILADKYGRRPSFSLAALCLSISSVMSGFSQNFYLFLGTRFCIGFGAVGCYGTAYTLLSELIVGRTKTLICCSFNISFAIGIIVLAAMAFYIRYWKLLLIAMSIPSLILPFFYWFLPESPHWLLSQNRLDDAWKEIHKIDSRAARFMYPSKITPPSFENKKKKPVLRIFIKPCTAISALFSNSKLAFRTLICFFVWFSISSTYIGLAINGQNFTVNKYLYIALNGGLEIFSYLIPIPLLNHFGRKTSSLMLFLLTGLLLISITFVPQSLRICILILALLGRFFSTSAYVIFALFTSELFPTTMRNTAIGASLTMSHVGTFISPYIVDILGSYLWYIPSTIFGLLSIISIIFVFFLPETKNKPSPNNIEEMNTYH